MATERKPDSYSFFTTILCTPFLAAPLTSAFHLTIFETVKEFWSAEEGHNDKKYPTRKEMIKK